MLTASASTRPWVRPRLRRIRSASTSRPSSRPIACCNAPETRQQSSGRVSHSACQRPRLRSCSCGIAANRVETSPGARVAAAISTALLTGLRLCGMVEEPPRPAPAGSKTSPASVCISRLTSRPNLPRLPATRPSTLANSTRRSRWVCQGCSGKARPSSSASAAATGRACSPSAASVPEAPPNCSTSRRGRNSRRRWRCRVKAPSRPASFMPRVTGVACCNQVRPASGVSACRSAWSAKTSARRCRSCSSKASARRSCSTRPLSMASWLVAPRCT